MDRKCHDSVVVVPKFENPLISFKGFFNLIGSTDSLFTSRNRAMCTTFSICFGHQGFQARGKPMLSIVLKWRRRVTPVDTFSSCP